MVTFPLLAAACAEAGIPATVDPDRREALVVGARVQGIRLPSAVAEWYAIDGAVEHFIDGSCAIIVRREDLAQDPDGCDGCHRAAGRLLVAADCQGCCDWLVDLRTVPDVPLPGLASPAGPEWAADPADPPVWLASPEDPAATWSLAAPSFSAYAYAEAWDLAQGRLPDYDIGWFPDDDEDLPPAAIDLTPLRHGFVAGPRSYGWAGCFGGPGLVVHRFARPGQRVRVAVHPRTAEWVLAAETAEQLERLFELLTADNAVLARELRPHRRP